MAERDSQVLTVPRDALLGVIQQAPEVSMRILETFNQRLQRLHDTVHGLVSERASVRLLRLIQYYASQYGTQSRPEGERLQIQLPYYQMARRIGISYEECARLLKRLDGIVRYERGGTLTVRDWAQLEAIAAEQ